jgi:putative peptide zinc metalloprotease protein
VPWDEIGTTFSDIWYRVADARPRLTPHAHVVRQWYGPTISYIIEDPASGQYYRLSESAYFFIGLLDGKRTVDEAWNACNIQLGDGAPTQRECIQLLSQLQLFGLLLSDSELAADMVLERKTQARETRIKKRTGMWVFWNIPLYNPEPLLERHKRLVGLLFSRTGAVVWLALVLTALYLLVRNVDRIGGDFARFVAIDPRGLMTLSTVFLVLRVVHELGHAAACKAMGGRSTEIGVIMIAGVLPLPYCDATSAWRFPQTWRRVLVSAGGILAETVLAAGAAIYWALADVSTAPMAVGIAYQVMVISSVTTLLFNLNPLLRYDGYYILSDVTGSPNLAQRSREFLKFLLERYAFGVKNNKPPRIRGRGEAWMLAMFGLLATPYRIFIGISISLVIMERYASVGLVLGTLMAVMWLVWPILKSVGYLVSSPRLLGRRARACSFVVLVIGLPLVGAGFVPVPSAEYAPAVVEPLHAGPLRAGESGFVKEVVARAGERVVRGDPVVVMYNPELEAQASEIRAKLAQATLNVDAAMQESAIDLQIAESKRKEIQLRLDRVEGQLDSLVLRAPVSGVVAPSRGTATDFDGLTGRYLTRGMLVGFVVSPENVVLAMVPDRSDAHVFGDASVTPHVRIRVRGDAGESIDGTIVSVAPMTTRDIENAAFSSATSGMIATDPAETDRMVALEPHRRVEIRPEASETNAIARAQPGVRARVRFGLPSEPLATQLSRRVRQYLSARLGG